MNGLCRRIHAGIVTMVIGTCAFSQSAPRYPSAPIKVIVPYPAGGQTDVLARLVAVKMSATLGQPVVVDNKPGAVSIIGTELVRKSAPDGYTLLFQAPTFIQNVVLRTNVPYDPFRDFVPVANCFEQALILAVPGDGPRTLEEFVAKAKAAIVTTYGTHGHGSVTHFYGETFGKSAGIQLTHVPYQGEAPIVKDLLGKQIDAGFVTGASVMQYEKTGKMRALAVAGARRLQGLPSLPTFRELGFDDVPVGRSFAGVLAPRGTPLQIVQQINVAVVDTCTHPDLKERLIANGVNPAEPNTPEHFGGVMREVHQEWIANRRNSDITIEE